MKYNLFVYLIILFFSWSVYAGAEIFRSHDTVRVTYQYKMPSAASWTNSNAVLRNVTTESMIENQLQSRHWNADVRILSAQTGRSQRAQIRYQYKRKGSNSWTNGNASLLDAKTEKMAANQLRAKHPDCAVRILSMKKTIGAFQNKIKPISLLWNKSTIKSALSVKTTGGAELF